MILKVLKNTNYRDAQKSNKENRASGGGSKRGNEITAGKK